MAKNNFDNFARFVEHCGDGDANLLLSNDMLELARHLAKVARETNMEAKGELVIKLKFLAQPKGQLDVQIDHKSTLPKMHIPDTVLWLDEKGAIRWENPRQPGLPGVERVRDTSHLARIGNPADDDLSDEGDDDHGIQ